MLWSQLVHLGNNYMGDDGAKNDQDYLSRNLPLEYSNYRPYVRLDDATWNAVVDATATAGLNGLVLDLHEAIAYESHPELGLPGAWSTARLREELDRLRELGIEPLPKLNFSTSHDIWLGEYARRVSTSTYYKVVSELIQEVAELFDTPRFFHLGMDEETIGNQTRRQLVVLRQHDQWWHDLEFLAEQVRAEGSRPWMWGDPAWHKPEEFYARMSRDVLQSNWYYNDDFTGDESGRPKPLTDGGTAWMTYLDLQDNEFDQIPTASTFFEQWAWENTVAVDPAHHWGGDETRRRAQDTLVATVAFAKERLDPTRVLGFLHTTWLPLIPEHLPIHLRAVDDLARAKRLWEGVA